MMPMVRLLSSQMGATTQTIVDQMAVTYVQAEYEALGVDLDAYQQHYLLVTGGKMLALTLLMVAAAILGGLLSSRVAASVGMELRGQQLQVEASGNVRCDPAWTAEALGNILKNCSEHMQEGTITVRAEENAVASVVVIRDTGGIAPQDLPHLFERYYKGENAPEQSVGIGLALSRSIAAAQNGTLTAANVPGGAEFTMKLYKGIV